MVPVGVAAKCICAASGVAQTLVDVSTLHVAVALEAGLTLADVVGRKVAAFRVLDTPKRINRS